MVLDIITIDNDSDGMLSKKCEDVPVGEIGTYKELVQNMLETTKYINALGLAANQIGTSRRLFVLADGTALFNPTVVARTNKVYSYGEGCLSVPGKRFDIKRHKSVVVRGLNLRGERITLRPKNKLVAFAIQHEIDHLDGCTLQDLGTEVV